MGTHRTWGRRAVVQTGLGVNRLWNPSEPLPGPQPWTSARGARRGQGRRGRCGQPSRTRTHSGQPGL